MHLKSEFRKRLIRLENAINNVLIADSFDKAEDTGNLFPFLASVYRYLWSYGNHKIFKK